MFPSKKMVIMTPIGGLANWSTGNEKRRSGKLLKWIVSQINSLWFSVCSLSCYTIFTLNFVVLCNVVYGTNTH